MSQMGDTNHHRNYVEEMVIVFLIPWSQTLQYLQFSWLKKYEICRYDKDRMGEKRNQQVISKSTLALDIGQEAWRYIFGC